MSNFKHILLKRNLSIKEIEVCDGISKELSSKEIAFNLNVSYQTIAFHIKNSIKKLEFKNKHQLVSYLIYLKDTGRELDWSLIERKIDRNIELNKIEANVC